VYVCVWGGGGDVVSTSRLVHDISQGVELWCRVHLPVSILCRVLDRARVTSVLFNSFFILTTKRVLHGLGKKQVDESCWV
jgi:hypothetical protein